MIFKKDYKRKETKKFFCTLCKQNVDKKFRSKKYDVCKRCFIFHSQRRIGDEIATKKI